MFLSRLSLQTTSFLRQPLSRISQSFSPSSRSLPDPRRVVAPGEARALEGILDGYKHLEYIAGCNYQSRHQPPLQDSAFLDGGDVLQVDDVLYVGSSTWTNEAGIRRLTQIVEPYSYKVRPVKVTSDRHLRAACSYLGDDTILANPDWVDRDSFAGFKILDVPFHEPYAANVLVLGTHLVTSSRAIETKNLLMNRGLTVEAIDIEELERAGAWPTRCCILFDTSWPTWMQSTAEVARAVRP